MPGWWVRLLRRNRMEDQLDKELQFHLDQHAADLMARGSDPQEARRQAQLALGGAEQVREACRDVRGTRWLEDLWQDLRYASRTLRQKPGFTLTALAALALGTGAVTTVLTLADTIFWRDLPVERPDRVVAVQATRRHGKWPGWVSYPDYVHFRDHVQTLAGLAAHYSTAPLFVTANHQAKELNGAVVSANFFPLLGVRPALGRFFRADEDAVPDRDRVAVISDNLWRNWFGASPDVLGATLKINGTMFQIVGVAPPEFRGVTVSPDELYIPLMMARAGYHWCKDSLAVDCTTLDMIGRLADGRTVAQAQAEIQALIPLAWAHAPEDENTGIHVFHAQGALHPDLTRAEQLRFIETLSGVAAVLILVCCVNVSGLLIARLSARSREFAIRASLGAGRMRLARQLIAEPLLLALAGGALGILLSAGFTAALNAMFYAMDVEGHPLFYNFTPEPRLLLIVIAVSIGIGMLIGAIPALKLHRAEPAGSLKREALTASTRPRFGLWLAGIQASAAVALTIVAGLLAAGVHTILSGDRFDPSHVALMRLRPRLLEYPPERAQRFLRTAIARLASTPGVESVSMVGNGAVLVGRGAHVGLPKWPDSLAIAAGYIEIGPRYFETLRTRVLRGREFDDRDTAQSPPVAIVTDSLAQRLWRDTGAVGATVLVNDQPHQVIGIVADTAIRQRGMTLEPYVYIPFWQIPAQLDARLAVRVKDDPATILPALARAVNAVDPDVPIAETIPLPQQIEGSIRSERVTGAFVSYAAAFTLLLSGVGLYGTLAFSVSRRTREIGIRLAVGAKPGEVLAMVIREGMAVMLAGVFGGLAIAIAAARMIQHLLFGTGDADPPVYAAAVFAVMAVGLLACWIPALRASRVDPISALRQD